MLAVRCGIHVKNVITMINNDITQRKPERRQQCFLGLQFYVSLLYRFLYISGCLTLLRSTANRLASRSYLPGSHLLSLLDLPQLSRQVTLWNTCEVTLALTAVCDFFSVNTLKTRGQSCITSCPESLFVHLHVNNSDQLYEIVSVTNL